MGNLYCEVVNKHSTKVSKMAASRSSTSAKRFANLDDKEYDEILQNKDAQTTKKATKQAVTIFREYVMEKGVDVDIQTVDKKALALILAKFYVEVRKVDGTHYKTTSLHSIRAGINRHLKSVHSEIIDITKDVEFTNANVAFKAATVELKKIGKGDIKHHEPIDPADIDKCYKSSVFDQDSPASLQAKVWFELSLFLCRRGRENLKDLKKDHFEVRRDANGREYLAQVLDELTKKTREDNMSSRTDGGRMYATGRADCPVASYKKYCEKLNKDNNNLFQTPKQSMPQSGPWYKKSSVGKNTLGDMMSTISKKAGLSRIYTNHCVRATCIGILDKAGFANREICQVSGHNNESSLSSYTGRVCNNTKMAMSDTISHALGGHQEVARPAPAATVSVPPEQDENQPPVPHVNVGETDNVNDLFGLNFDLDFDDFDLELPNSQLSVMEVHSQSEVTEEVAVVENQNNVNGASGSVIRNTTSTTNTTTRQAMQVQQTPFVLNNCTVTINYFNKN